jgi:hypothetical protein
MCWLSVNDVMVSDDNDALDSDANALISTTSQYHKSR